MAFSGFLAATLTLYILRGFAIFTALPGSILWLLLFGTLITGVLLARQVLR